MTCYIVKMGINIQGVYGSYANEVDAIEAFYKAYNAAPFGGYGDFDGYHTYHIIDKLPDIVGDRVDEGTNLIKYISKK